MSRSSRSQEDEKERSRLQHERWADVRQNVHYEGCYPDYAYLHPEFQDPRFYHVPRVKGQIVSKHVSRFAEATLPPGPVDPRLPPPRAYRAYLDGPARIIPSIDRRLAHQPESQTLDRALRRCYDLAQGQNKKYFALQNGGKLCLATNSPDFMQWGKLPDNECRACGHKCPQGQKPCGERCVRHDRKCTHRQHRPCAHDAPDTGTKGGGYFTNSVFSIKDMEHGREASEVPPDVPDEFARFRYAPPEVTDEMACPNVPNNFFDLSPTQLFMQQYFNIDTPIKGLLVYKSAGAGKTCEALNVIGNFMGQWRIFWVTRQSLRDTPLKNLYRDICQIRLRELIDAPEPLTLASGEVLATTKDEKIAFIRSERGPAVLKRYGIEIEKQRIISYDNFVKMIAGKGADGRKLLDQQLEDSPNGDLGYQTLFVFDEAHNLISPGLPAEERQELDAVFDDVSIGERRFSRRSDVYGSDSPHPDAPLVGRDLIPAMFWESYRRSKKNSAKCLILTGTPMSTSPSELFWLLNLTLDVPKQRLSLQVSDYYDPATMRLRDEAVLRFAQAAHGRISFLDITQNPTTFARKIFFDRMNVVLHKFHQQIIDEAVEKEKARADQAGEKLDWTKMVALYQNLALMARTKGSFYDEETLQNYDRELARMKDWNPESEQQYQADLYAKGANEARRVFKLEVRETDQKAYERKVEQYHKWANQHAGALRRPDQPEAAIADVMDANGDLLTVDEWLRKNAAEAAFSPSEADVPKDVAKRYATLVKRKEDYEQKLRDGKKPRRPQLSELLKVDGSAKTLVEFYKDVWATQHMKRRDASEYDQLSRRYRDFKAALAEQAQRSKQRRGRREELPERPPGVDEVMDEYGELMPLEQWFLHRIAPKRAKKEKKRYTKAELPYLKFLIRDPASGLMRMRTLDEFVQVRDPQPTLEGKETRKNVSMLMWYKNFDAGVARQLMPFYAPRIHTCIQTILQREEQAQRDLGHGLKHTVFTFSTAGKGTDSAGFGARAVASAFHAYQDLFRVLLVYKENDEGQFVLHHDLPSTGPEDHRWGVAVLSSKDLPNIYLDEYGGNQKVEYNFKVIGATQAAFNDARNRYGDRIKVLIMDGAYTEGVEAYDDNVGHFLNEGLSPPQLEQASSRSVRYCRSKNIPFFKGVGGFMEMYFYAQEGLNEQMLQYVPYDEQLNINMMDVFKDLSAQFSIDYWLNLNVNDFRPVYSGQLTEYYDKWNRAYVVTKPLEISERNEASKHVKHVDYRFLVDPDSLVTRIQKGSEVTDPSGWAAVVVDWQAETRKFEIEYVHDRSHAWWSEAELRLSPGQTVDFQIPYGTDLAKKVMNIGNYNVMHPSDLSQELVTDIRIPEQALQAVSTAFRNNVLYLLLGLVAMLRLVIKAGGAGVPLHIVTPPPDEGDAVPAMSNFAMRWTFSASGARDLRYASLPMKQFLAPKEGLSLMFLTLQQQPEAASEHDHVNVLLYVPEWGTVERFDPMGYVAHAYDSVVLDSRLHDLFQKLNPELRYMSSAETCPLFGLQRLQVRERTRHQLDPSSYCTVFALFYMHMRILYASQHLKQYPREKREVFPLQFQRGLVRAMKDQSGLHLTEYIRNYAELAVSSKAFVSSWDQYRENEPFWANTARLVQILQKLAGKTHTVGEESVAAATSRQQKKQPSAAAAAPSFFGRLRQLTASLW